MLLGWESYARVIHECSPVRACKGAACNLVSSQPFLVYTCNLLVALPYRLYPRNSSTKERKDFSLHPWGQWNGVQTFSGKGHVIG